MTRPRRRSASRSRPSPSTSSGPRPRANSKTIGSLHPVPAAALPSCRGRDAALPGVRGRAHDAGARRQRRGRRCRREPRTRRRGALLLRIRRRPVRDRLGRAPARLPRFGPVRPSASTSSSSAPRPVPPRCRSSGPHTVTVPGPSPAGSTSSSGGGRCRSRELAAPALRYARDGFELTPRGAQSLEWSCLALRGIRRRCSRPTAGLAAGDVLRQPGLARTFELLARGRTGRLLPRCDRARDRRSDPRAALAAERSRRALGDLGRAR